MVKSHSPLTGLSASGTIGGNLTYGKTRRGTTIRKTPRRTKPQSQNQTACAAMMKHLQREWSDLTAVGPVAAE